MFINQKNSSKGFTLIELLVVIAIIASLAAIAFPLTRSILDKGKATETKMRMQEFESAVNAYNNDTGRLPFSGDDYPSGDQPLSTTQLVDVISILLGQDDSEGSNDLGKKYLLMSDAKNSKNGITYTDNTRTTIKGMTDAWGNEFHVQIDYELDGDITQTFSSDTDSKIENKKVILISPGADLDPNGEDDVYSWK